MDTTTEQGQRLLGQSAAFLAAVAQASQLAVLDKPVLIVGERGTGKELFAARLHYLSKRWDRPYVQVNCAAFSDNLLESELFGHEAGAFTGAVRRHAGRFERADRGTLFLDELAHTSARVQEQLLRIVEYGRFERLGGRETLAVDVRLVAATNEDLPARAASGRFRHDLLDRLSFDVITLPPLRAREGDVLLLAEQFATQMTRELGRPMFAGFTDAARTALLSWHWPGNVRELRNVIERSLYRHEDWERPLERVVLDPFDSPFRPVAPAALPATHAPAAHAREITVPVDLRKYLAAEEARCIRAALGEARYHQRRAAARLGLGYHQLRAAMRRLGLDAHGEPRAAALSAGCAESASASTGTP
jgi:psp operon transcriptional activator